MLRRYYNPETQSGNTGRILERQLFGEFDVENPAYQTALKKVVRPGGYVPFDESLYLVRKFYQDDPINPRKDFLRDLRLEVLDALGGKKPLPDDSVLAYTSVGTPFDFKHHADAFLVIKQNGREEIIRIDASRRPEKINAAARGESEADIFVSEDDVPDAVQEQDKYLESIARFADRVLIALDRRNREREARPAAAA